MIANEVCSENTALKAFSAHCIRGVLVVAGSLYLSTVASADPDQKRFVMMDVTGRYTASTVIDAMSQKATSCWLATDPAFAGLSLVGKRLGEDGKTVLIDFKPATKSRAQKADKRAPAKKSNEDLRVASILAIPTFSGGFAVFVQQGDGIDIVSSLQDKLDDLERYGVIKC